MAKESKKSRVLVNLIGIPLILSCIFLGNTQIPHFPLFSFFIYFVMILSIWEWHNLSNIECSSIQVVNFMVITGLFFLIHFKISLEYFFLMLILYCLLITTIETLKSSKNPLLIISSSIFGIIWVGFFIGSIILIRDSQFGFQITLMMFTSIWVCDTFAFFFGSRYGRRKLMSKVSPNKTWIGAICGFMGSFIIPIVISVFYPIDDFILFDYIICGFIFGIFGQLGDLSESLLKRSVNIKDTSNILHGHGGVLDRFDSLSFASPMLFIFLYSKNLI